MKILFLTTVFNFGGAQRSTLELANRLKDQHEIKFYDTYGCCERFINSLIVNKINYSILSESSSAYIIKKHTNFFLNLPRFLYYIFKWRSIRYRVREKMAEFQPDIVLIYDYRCLSYLLGVKSKKIKVIYYAREWYTPSQIPFIKKIFLKYFVDCFICVSEATRQALYCGKITSMDKLFVVHNAMNTDKTIDRANIEPAKHPNHILKIIHSGAFIKEKGQHISLEAIKILTSRGINVHLYLCGLIYSGNGNGSQEYLNTLQAFINKNDLNNNVSVLIGQYDILSLIGSCDIMFSPTCSEGLPRSIMEAMSLGKPVIANAAGGVTDLVIDGFTGYLTKFNDPNDYADYSEKIFKNPELYHQISANAKNLIFTSFSEQAQMFKMNDVLNHLLSYVD